MSDSMLWERIGELADQAQRNSDLLYHKLHLVAASRMRRRSEEIPAVLRQAEREAAVMRLSAAPLVRRIRAATDASIIVMKGPEAAAYWPDPRLRPWSDLDLLVDDPNALQASLLRSGFVEVGEPAAYRDLHHLCPLIYPGIPLAIEVHRRPHWPGDSAPAFGELAEAAIPATLDVPGVLTPNAVHHAVLLAGHAWGHDSLSRVAFLADVAAAAGGAPDEAAAVARAWGVSRVWSATTGAIDELLLTPSSHARPPIWLRHLHETRERTVFEGHVQRLLGPVAARPVAAAPAAATRALWRTLRPVRGESWSAKLQRSRTAVNHASLRQSEHDDQLAGG